MGKRKRASSSSLFLMELILAILFFCISGTVCISAFARSHIMHTQSAELNNSIKTARDVAELIRSGKDEGDIISSFNKIYGVDASLSNDDIIICLDSDFSVSPEQTQNSSQTDGYYVRISPLLESDILSCTIDVCKSDPASQNEVIYSLNIERSF